MTETPEKRFLIEIKDEKGNLFGHYFVKNGSVPLYTLAEVLEVADSAKSKWISEVRREVEEKKRLQEDCGCAPCEGCGCKVDDYNEALDNVLSLDVLKEKNVK